MIPSEGLATTTGLGSGGRRPGRSSRVKHRSLTGHSKMSKMVARLVPHYEFDIDDFFRSDGATAEVATRRQDGFFRLAGVYKDRYAKGRQMTAEAATRISDLEFTET